MCISPGRLDRGSEVFNPSSSAVSRQYPGIRAAAIPTCPGYIIEASQTKEDYYHWMTSEVGDDFWPESLAGKDAFDNFLVSKVGSGLNHGGRKGDGFGGVTDDGSGSTGDSGSSGGNAQASTNPGGNGGSGSGFSGNAGSAASPKRRRSDQ